MNDDDALDVFKKALPSSSLMQEQLGFLQKSDRKANPARTAQAMLATLASKHGPHSSQISLMLYTLGSKLRQTAKGKAAGFEKIIKMIDDMVSLLAKEQDDDDKQKDFCSAEFDRTADEEAASKSQNSAIQASIAEQTDAIAQLAEEVATLKEGIKSLDKTVAEATEQRKEEHQEYTETMQMS